MCNTSVSPGETTGERKALIELFLSNFTHLTEGRPLRTPPTNDADTWWTAPRLTEAGRS
ncbi:hypothetical protein GCM10027072_47550 [Streptomyces bullii]